MTDKTKNAYLPDYLVAPGEVLLDFLEELNITQAELSDRTGLTRKTVNGIVKAKDPISPETALKLERVLGRSAQYWSNLERNYQDDKVRLAEKIRMETQLHWLDNFPINEMAKLGWIQKSKDKVEQLEILLQFFGIASPNQWVAFWGNLQVQYRQTTKQKKSVEAISAWLRQGEIEAQKEQKVNYDSKRFQNTLKESRKLTAEPLMIFLPELVSLCASAGVRVVFIPALPKMGVYGATRWLGGNPVIQLSLYYKSNDHLWFTFFHEAGHILKHGRKDIFLESNDSDPEKKEEEANLFAQKMLIPQTRYAQFLQSGIPTLTHIKTFAQEISIAPGIVVGRLQKEKIIPWSMGNNLKVFY
jgi:addiction module HigA family antidote